MLTSAIKIKKGKENDNKGYMNGMIGLSPQVLNGKREASKCVGEWDDNNIKNLFLL